MLLLQAQVLGHAGWQSWCPHALNRRQLCAATARPFTFANVEVEGHNQEAEHRTHSSTRRRGGQALVVVGGTVLQYR